MWPSRYQILQTGKIIFPHKFVTTSQSTRRTVLIHARCTIRDHACHFSRCKLRRTLALRTPLTHTGTLPYRFLSDCVQVCKTVATLSLLVRTARSSISALAYILPCSVSYKLITQSCKCNPRSKFISPTFPCLYHIVRFPESRKIPLTSLKYYLQ
jgi:hypothetical protein